MSGFSKTTSSIATARAPSYDRDGPTLKSTLRLRGRSSRGVTNLHPLHTGAETARPAFSQTSVQYVAGGTPRMLVSAPPAMNANVAAVEVRLVCKHSECVVGAEVCCWSISSNSTARCVNYSRSGVYVTCTIRCA